MGSLRAQVEAQAFKHDLSWFLFVGGAIKGGEAIGMGINRSSISISRRISAPEPMEGAC